MSALAAPPEGAGPPPAPERRSRHTARWVAGAVAVVLVVVAVVAALQPTNQAAQVASPLVGHPAPQFSGPDLEGGHASLAGYRGRYVYVNFFASWCTPCQQEEANLVAFAFQQSRQRTGAGLVSVVFNDSASAAGHFVSQWGATWPAVLDHGGTIANDYGVGSTPVTFLVDPKGTVVGAFDGPVKTSQLTSMLASARRSHG